MNVQRGADGKFVWKMNLSGIHQNYPALLAAVPPGPPYPGPALFIRGAKSDYLPEAKFPLVRKLFPRAEFVTHPEAGHWVHADQPDLFVRTALAFLGRE